MRWDLTGIFWDDYVEPRVPVEKVKRTPPEPVWLEDDYLPDLEQAKAHVFDLMTDAELIAAQQAKERLIWDTEFYPNYALLGFRGAVSGKVLKFEIEQGETLPESDKFQWVLSNFTVVGFNDTTFDVPMALAAIKGYSTEKLFSCVQDLILGRMGQVSWERGMKPHEFYRAHKIKPFFVDNIDLIELTPLAPSLKVAAGRFHAQRMADLPYPAGKVLTPEQRTVLRWYWANDLENTFGLYKQHKTALELREILTKDYGVDVRSKSDPQIAEQVIRAEIKRITKRPRIETAKIEPGRAFRFFPAAYVQFSSPTMQWVLDFIRRQRFVVDQWGSPTESKELSDLKFEIGGTTYKMGIGGLHSQEKRVIHVSDDEFELTDNDVTSYYPMLIIQQGMYPPNVGPVFLQVFKRIVERRIAAKRAGDKATAETLKIVANGTFGKTGERGGYSVVYYPEMMIQVTLSGQLALLMLIERLEMAGIQVISANTDGIMIKCPRAKLDLKKQIIAEWEKATGLELETTPYKAIYSRDVNNYIALYEKPKEGDDAYRFAKAIGAYRKTLGVYPLKWNPTCDICPEAVIAYLAEGTPVEETIRNCQDVRKFIEVRLVRGGACKNGEYYGKAIRWYYAKGVEDEIINASNGYTVPRSKGAKACMVLPQGIPDDLDRDYYVQRALDILDDFAPKQKKERKAA